MMTRSTKRKLIEKEEDGRQIESVRGSFETYQNEMKEKIDLLVKKDEELKVCKERIERFNFSLVNIVKDIHDRHEVDTDKLITILNEKYESLREKDESLREKDESLIEKDESLKEKDESLREKDESLREKDESLREKDESLREKDESLREKDESLREKDESLREKDESLREKDESLREKDEMINHLKEGMKRQHSMFNEKVQQEQRDKMRIHNNFVEARAARWKAEETIPYVISFSDMYEGLEGNEKIDTVFGTSTVFKLKKEIKKHIVDTFYKHKTTDKHKTFSEYLKKFDQLNGYGPFTISFCEQNKWLPFTLTHEWVESLFEKARKRTEQDLQKYLEEEEEYKTFDEEKINEVGEVVERDEIEREEIGGEEIGEVGKGKERVCYESGESTTEEDTDSDYENTTDTESDSSSSDCLTTDEE